MESFVHDTHTTSSGEETFLQYFTIILVFTGKSWRNITSVHVWRRCLQRHNKRLNFYMRVVFFCTWTNTSLQEKYFFTFYRNNFSIVIHNNYVYDPLKYIATLLLISKGLISSTWYIDAQVIFHSDRLHFLKRGFRILRKTE